jgi:hypothetical protein
MTIEPDTKDWTWVLDRRCEECGFAADEVPVGELAGHIVANAGAWVEVLDSPGDAAQRPDDQTWSPLEYACHVRDVHRLMTARLGRMTAEDDPVFDDWDQDATAVEDRYSSQDPARVSEALVEAARAGAARLAGVHPHAWGRPGRRSNGFVFSVESLGRYWLHDVEHHLRDVRPA